MTNKSNQTSPLGEDAQRAGGGLRITLTRYMHNRTFTHGKLTFEGSDFTFETIERAIPRDRYSYVKHCLPPGEYPIRVEMSLLTLKNGSIRKPWLAPARIKWFPSTAFFTNFQGNIPPSGAIIIGLSSKDEWSIEQNDIVTAQIVSILTPIYDPSTNQPTKPVTLHIIESPDIIFHDYDQRQHEADLAAQEELKQRQEAELFFQQISKSVTEMTNGV